MKKQTQIEKLKTPWGIGWSKSLDQITKGIYILESKYFIPTIEFSTGSTNNPDC